MQDLDNVVKYIGMAIIYINRDKEDELNEI